MKKEVPTWAVYSSIAAAVAVGGFFLFRAVSGPPEIAAPKIRVSQEIPDHLKGRLSPEMEAQIREQTRKYGEIDPTAPKTGSPPRTPPSGG